MIVGDITVDDLWFQHLGKDSDRGYQALYTVNEMINACDVTDQKTFQR